MGKATDDLRHEHECILSVLDIADDVMKSNHPEKEKLKFGNDFIYFLSIFTDRCHHGKEEAHLFPTLVLKGVPERDGPVGVMLQEHVTGRAIVSSMRSAVENQDLVNLKQTMSDYATFIRNHIAKENNVLFPLADKVIPKEEQDEMAENFDIHEEDVVGHGVHDQLHKMVDQWIIDYEIKD
jgi:hemerythrin-like domain-containing protein